MKPMTCNQKPESAFQRAARGHYTPGIPHPNNPWFREQEHLRLKRERDQDHRSSMHDEPTRHTGPAPIAAAPALPARAARRGPLILAGQLMALVACAATVAFARWGHRYIGYGHGIESLWTAARPGGDSSSPLREVDFQDLLAALGACFGLIALSLVMFRRAMSALATLAALVVVWQSLRIWLGFGPHWNASHAVGPSFWLSTGAAIIIALGAAIATTAPSRRTS